MDGAAGWLQIWRLLSPAVVADSLVSKTLPLIPNLLGPQAPPGAPTSHSSAVIAGHSPLGGCHTALLWMSRYLLQFNCLALDRQSLYVLFTLK